MRLSLSNRTVQKAEDATFSYKKVGRQAGGREGIGGSSWDRGATSSWDPWLDGILDVFLSLNKTSENRWWFFLAFFSFLSPGN